MNDKQWAALSNTFLPFESVPPDRLDDWFVKRPDSPLEALALLLSPDKIPQRRILVGQPASGKSSELTKLAEELQKRYEALVVRFDMTDNLDVERANPVEVIFLMGAALFKVASAELPLDGQPDSRLLEDLKAGLVTIVRTHTKNETFELDVEKLLKEMVVFGGAGLAVVGAAFAGPVGALAGSGALQMARVVAEKFTPLRFTSGTSAEVVRKLEVEPKVEAMVDALNAIIEDVRRKSSRPLILLVDGLDKLRDADVISLNFLETTFLNGPTCSVLYTGPLDLYYSPRFGSVRTRFKVIPFPQVKLRQRANPEQCDTAGYQFMRDVVHQRLRSLGHIPEDVIEPAALEVLIEARGGVMRDLIRLFQEAALQAQIGGKPGIGDPEAREAANERRRQLMAQLTPDYHRVLDEVRDTHQRVGGEDEQRCDLLLRNDMLLSYVNKDIWFAPHAALTKEPW